MGKLLVVVLFVVIGSSQAAQAQVVGRSVTGLVTYTITTCESDDTSCGTSNPTRQLIRIYVGSGGRLFDYGDNQTGEVYTFGKKYDSLRYTLSGSNIVLTLSQKGKGSLIQTIAVRGNSCSIIYRTANSPSSLKVYIEVQGQPECAVQEGNAFAR